MLQFQEAKVINNQEIISVDIEPVTRRLVINALWCFQHLIQHDAEMALPLRGGTKSIKYLLLAGAQWA